MGCCASKAEDGYEAVVATTRDSAPTPGLLLRLFWPTAVERRAHRDGKIPVCIACIERSAEVPAPPATKATKTTTWIRVIVEKKVLGGTYGELRAALRHLLPSRFSYAGDGFRLEIATWEPRHRVFQGFVVDDEVTYEAWARDVAQDRRLFSAARALRGLAAMDSDSDDDDEPKTLKPRDSSPRRSTPGPTREGGYYVPKAVKPLRASSDPMTTLTAPTPSLHVPPPSFGSAYCPPTFSTCPAMPTYGPGYYVPPGYPACF